MANFADMIDGHDIDNRYAGKVIVYVESESDVRLFEKFIGPGYGERLEFKIPPEGGTGSGPAKSRTLSERISNPKVFALLDGEAAVTSDDSFETLLKCERPIFSLVGAENEGFLFLAEHEAENILLRYSDVSGFIQADATLTGMGQRTEAEVIASMDSITRYWFVAAICKYASSKLHAQQSMSGIIDNGIFRNPGGRFCVGRLLKKKVEDKQCDWSTFRTQLGALIGRIENHFASLDEGGQSSERQRLADGKNILIRLRAKFNVSPNWEGHLVEHVAGQGYPGEFRATLFEMTNA